tara:strand:+ start:2036 stop:3226 length:1191 start_codon:yes stop_codon:yes gene_type:complete
MAKKSDSKALITIGGWYQRTTLHLSEVHGFLSSGKTKISSLSSHTLAIHKKKLNLSSVSREIGELEYVKALSKDGIEIKYYEDGLFTLQTQASLNKISEVQAHLTKYFEKSFLPAITYLFSVGAPTPKELANIKINHPKVIGLVDRNHSTFAPQDKYGQVYNKITSNNVTVHKTKSHIFVVASPSQKKNLPRLIEMQIFFREFKDQLERYLSIHRTIWQQISEIKEQHSIKGKDISKYRAQLESYKKSIQLISSRINQMSTYAHTRASISRNLKLQSSLLSLFQYRFEDLFNTLSYIKDIWSMTSNYVNSAIQTVQETQNKVMSHGIRSIQILAGIGVIAGILGYLTRDSLPTLSSTGFIYLIGLGIIALIVDFVIKSIYKNKKYNLVFTERAKQI